MNVYVFLLTLYGKVSGTGLYSVRIRVYAPAEWGTYRNTTHYINIHLYAVVCNIPGTYDSISICLVHNKIIITGTSAMNYDHI